MAITRPLIGLVAVAALWLGIVPATDMAEFGAVGTARAAELASESRDLPPFSRIDVRGNFEIQITVGARQNVLVETAERDFKRLKTEVRGEKLFLSFRKRWFSFLFGSQRIVAISLPVLRGMEFSGAGDINVTGIDSEAFDLAVNGAGDIALKGSCGALDFTMSGAGDVMARELQCKSAAVLINGVGSTEIYASESINAVLNGVGSIEVYGNPEKVSKQINGFGDFEIVE